MDNNISYIKVNNVVKKIKGNTVLNNINLNLEKGKIYGFKGINGSGKTMLFRTICGLIKPTEGEVLIEGKKLGSDMSFPPSIGVIIEYPGFLPQYTGVENLKILAEIQNKISENEIKVAINRVGLKYDDKRKFKKYYLGMKQRLGIAQAIMEDPDLLILDEPTNALDQDGIKMVMELLKDLKNKNKSILISSHDKDFLESMADEIFTIESGAITSHVIQ